MTAPTEHEAGAVFRAGIGAPRLVRSSPAGAVYAVDIAPHHLNGIHIAHGGFLASACIDVARTCAGEALGPGEVPPPVIRARSCHIDFFRAASPEARLMFEASVSPCRRAAVGVRIVVSSEDAPDNVILTGWSIWTRT